MATTIEATVTLLKELPDLALLVAGRIAAKHRYGPGASDWKAGEAGLVVAGDTGGAPAGEGNLIYGHEGRLTVQCYGSSPAAALTLWHTLVTACAGIERRSVRIGALGRVLVYWIMPVSEPTLVWDEELLMDVALGQLSVMISGTGVAA